MQDIPIVFENSDLVIVNKPVGLAMHDEDSAASDGEIEQSGAGIVTLLKKQLNVEKLHLCHRLDTGTSGCLCLAKKPSIASEIGELFASRKVNKYYLALSAQKPKKKQGSVIGDMKNRRGGQRILLKTTDNPAITQFFSQSAIPGIRGFIVKPRSGKTHQIRVALKSVGAPILGDELYGGARADRLYLHALKLIIPLSNGVISVNALPTSGELFDNNLVDEWVASMLLPEHLAWPTLPSRFTCSNESKDVN